MKSLTLREINRAFLARQHLLRRTPLDPLDAVEQLAGLQAQWQPSPYLSLWSRIANFSHDALARDIARGRLVKATLMRATLHLVSAREYPAYSVATSQRRTTAWRPEAGVSMETVQALHDRALAFAAKEPRTRREIADHLSPDLPRDENRRAYLMWSVLASGSLVLEPECAHHNYRGSGRYVAAPARLRKPVAPADAHALLVRRYLAAFGPATTRDLANWSGARAAPLREGLARLGANVVRFFDERGRELLDLADAPRPHADTPAPPRLLPRFDAAILGHEPARRERILPEPYRRAIIFAAEVGATFLIDGFVAGTWSLDSAGNRATVHLRPFATLAPRDAEALAEEARALAKFVAPGAAKIDIRSKRRSASRPPPATRFV